MLDAATVRTRETLFGRRSHGSPGVYGVLALDVLLFVLAERWGGSEVSQVIARMGAASQALVAEGEGWRLLASGYLHFGFEHLANNLVSIWFFGRILEGALGTARFLLLYGASVLCAAAAHCALSPEGLLAGASGGAFGILGGSLMLLHRAPERLPRFSRAGYAALMVAFIGVSLALSQRSAVSLAAHAGGAAAGAGAVWLGLATWGLPPAGSGRPEARAVRNVVRGLAAAAIVATTAAIAHGIHAYRPWALAVVPPSETVRVPGTPVVVDVPGSLRLRASFREVDGVRELAFGDIRFDPVSVRLTTDRPRPPGTRADLREVVAGFAPDLLRSVGPGEVVASEPVPVDVAGHPWLMLASGNAAFDLERWSTLLAGYRVNLVVAVAHGAPEAWREAAADLVASIHGAAVPAGPTGGRPAGPEGGPRASGAREFLDPGRRGMG